MWCDGATRTTPTEIAELIAGGQIAVATAGEDIVGSVQIHQVAPDANEFGMLVAAPDRRGTGIGRALLDFTEDPSRERELRTVQLELLVPRDWLHPTKEFLKRWYRRRGYRRIRVGTPGANRPAARAPAGHAVRPRGPREAPAADFTLNKPPPISKESPMRRSVIHTLALVAGERHDRDR
jgi:GNAT superfamily N-acetyltransferase